MRQETEEDRLVVQYLLGELPEAEMDRLEEKYFVDQTMMERVSAIEDRLIDEYVNGELSAVERRRFEKHFMATPRRMEKARLSLALRAAITQRAPGLSWIWALLSAPRFRAVALASACLALAFGWWSALRSRSEWDGLLQRTSVAERRLTESQAREQALGRLIEQLRSQEGNQAGKQLQPPVISFLLTPGLTRATESARRLSIPPGDVRVRFQLKLPATATTTAALRVSLRTDDDSEIWSEAAGSPTSIGGEPILLVTIPGSVLHSGDFTIGVEAAGPDGQLQRIASYSLRLVQR